ncbi:MAG: virulence protein SciE type [Phycisphaerae bacterium]|nr:virulence protein SciE type [Phycisphaerae bacterium]
MQAAEQLVREGKLDDALATLQDAIRKDPSNAKLRIFLFQLLCVRGDWDRAQNQLGVAKELDAGAVLMAQVCSQAIQCERLREGVFSGKRTPLVFGEPAAWVGQLVQANKLLAEGHHDHAAQLRDQAFEDAPAISGTVNGEPFEWIADADVRLGPMFEALIEGKYYWVPMTAVAKLEIDEPADLRDVVWAPGTFTFTNGGTAIALLPVRYPGSEASDDDAIRLARKTDFAEPAENTYLGVGQRMWATDAGEYAMLATRELILGDGPPEIVEPEPSDG